MKFCRKCNQEKPLVEFYFDLRRNNYSSPCKECRKVIVAKLNHKWRKDNPERSKVSSYRTKLKIAYGITPEILESMLQAQDYTCAICRAALSLTSTKKIDKPHVDHSHVTGVVRGLLCSTCNTGLGMLKDSPQILAEAIKYLSRGTSVLPKPSDSNHPLIDTSFSK